MIYTHIEDTSYKIDENSHNGQFFLRGLMLHNVVFDFEKPIENPNVIIDASSDTAELCASSTIFNDGYVDCGGASYTTTEEVIDGSEGGQPSPVSPGRTIADDIIDLKSQETAMQANCDAEIELLQTQIAELQSTIKKLSQAVWSEPATAMTIEGDTDLSTGNEYQYNINTEPENATTDISWSVE